MSVEYRDEGDAHLVGSERRLAGLAPVTVARAASPKTTTAPRAE